VAHLTFLGAAQTVTGSKYLLEHGDARVLVDCGLFQGLKPLRLRNWEALPVPAREIDAVVLTHAHLDHTGYLPRLVSQGFRGRVFCTAGTKDLCGLILPDSARIQEEDARRANRHGYSKHHPALPLYGEGDAYRALTQLQPVGYHRPMPVAPGIEAEFVPAGHLLGSAFVVVRLDSGKTIVFGGDLGRYNRPVLKDPSPAGVETDLLLLESTYGDRDHAPDDDGETLAGIVRETHERGGKLIIPAFAIGRTEELIYWLRRLEAEKRIPVLPVYLDSPMAIDALTHYQRRTRELDSDMQPGEKDACTFCTERFQTVPTPEQSKAVTASRAPAIVISASGRATGGRVLHHLEAALPDERNTVLFAGYQAAGTRGRRLVESEPEVKIHGRMIPVRARVAQLDSVSAHADRGEILRWLGTFPAPPKRIALVHGEPRSITALAALVRERLALDAHPAEDGERIEV
jgi:metallo-beta-lactamase family protein